MIRHFTVSDNRMTISANRCVESALDHGCDSSHAYLVPKDYPANIYNNHRRLLDQDRGAGYWAWKSVFLHWELMDSDKYDYIVYTDAGLDFVNNIEYLIDDMDSDVMLFGNGWKHTDWCKANVLDAMNVPLSYSGDQAQATCIIVKPSTFSKRFVSDWLNWCLMEWVIDDSESNVPNSSTFREHRHDQAILTNLAIKYDIPFNRWPAQYKLRGSEKYTNGYPQIFNHHRKRNDEWNQ